VPAVALLAVAGLMQTPRVTTGRRAAHGLAAAGLLMLFWTGVLFVASPPWLPPVNGDDVARILLNLMLKLHPGSGRASGAP